MNGYKDFVLDFVKSQDDLEFSLGDSLDVKASIMLVVVTFLANQSSEFLGRAVPLAAHWQCMQVASIVCLVVAGISSLLLLRLKKYSARMVPQEFVAWANKVRTCFSADPQRDLKTLDEIADREIEKANVRFSENNSINVRKARMLKWCFRFAFLSLAANLITLGGLYLGY